MNYLRLECSKYACLLYVNDDSPERFGDRKTAEIFAMIRAKELSPSELEIIESNGIRYPAERFL